MSVNFISTLLIVLLLQSCGLDPVKGLSLSTKPIAVETQLGEVSINYCLLETTLATDVKTIFMLDRSASNCSSQGTCPDATGTDTDRTKRTNGILKYLTENEFTENEYFALGEFYCPGCTGSSQGNGTQDPSIEPDVPGLGAAPNLTPQNEFSPFMKNLSSLNNPNLHKPFNNVVQEFQNTADVTNRGTNYRKALESIKSMIETDAENSKLKYDEEIANGTPPSEIEIKPAVYKIVFASDGQPTDTGSSKYESHLLNYIKDDILALEDDATLGPFIQKVYLSAAFYHYQENPVAEKLIEDMAEYGKGKFLSFNNGEEIDFEKLLNIPVVNVRTSEVQMLVQNMNTLWGFQETADQVFQYGILADSDGDGLADIDEYPSCINLKDCDANGVNDFVEYYVFNSPCATTVKFPSFEKICDLEYSREICDLTKAIEDEDNDGLNNCEEDLLKTNTTSFDSNSDQLSDAIGFRNRLDIVKEATDNSSPRSQTELDDDSDSVNNFLEVKHFTPVEYNNSKVKGLVPYVYEKTPVPTSGDTLKKCYELKVKDIAIITPEDEIEINFIQKEANGTGKQYYQRIRRNLKDGKLELNRSDFN